jgi:hypothetical protein
LTNSVQSSLNIFEFRFSFWVDRPVSGHFSPSIANWPHLPPGTTCHLSHSSLLCSARRPRVTPSLPPHPGHCRQPGPPLPLSADRPCLEPRPATRFFLARLVRAPSLSPISFFLRCTELSLRHATPFFAGATAASPRRAPTTQSRILNADTAVS